VENARTRNDLGAALVRFCVAVEEHRRTPEGRVRTSVQFLEHFFATQGGAPKDELFRHMPKEVRGPILSGWGIRGAKAALRDDDEKVASVVFDALAAGDLDADAFESALAPTKLLAWVPLPSFWSFWRAGAISKPSLLRALTSAYELKLLDAKAFFDNLKARNGELTSTDVLGNALNKDDLIEWVRKIHAAGDGSPKGLLEALGWEKIVAKASTESLLGALDALAIKLGLAEPPPEPVKIEAPKVEEPSVEATTSENGAAKTPAGAEVAIETEETAPKTDPPPPDEHEVVIQASDLAKTGPYATPMSAPRLKRDEEDLDEETKLYRQKPLRR
jgi:hypothetical protein